MLSIFTFYEMVTYDRSDYDPYLNFINPSARNVHCILQWLSSFKMTWCFNIYHFSIFKFCIHDIALAWFPLYFEYRASEHRYFTLTFTRQHCWKKEDIWNIGVYKSVSYANGRHRHFFLSSIINQAIFTKFGGITC